MKKILLTLTLSLGLIACSTKKIELPVSAPQTRVTLLNGDYVYLNKLFNNNAVVVFWSEWCAKSRHNVIKLNAIAKNYKANNSLNFIAINLDNEKDINKVKSFINKNSIHNFIHASSGNEGMDEAFVSFQGQDLPHIFVVKNNQIVSEVHSVKELLLPIL